MRWCGVATVVGVCLGGCGSDDDPVMAAGGGRFRRRYVGRRWFRGRRRTVGRRRSRISRWRRQRARAVRPSEVPLVPAARTRAQVPPQMAALAKAARAAALAKAAKARISSRAPDISPTPTNLKPMRVADTAYLLDMHSAGYPRTPAPRRQRIFFFSGRPLAPLLHGNLARADGPSRLRRLARRLRWTQPHSMIASGRPIRIGSRARGRPVRRDSIEFLREPRST